MTLAEKQLALRITLYHLRRPNSRERKAVHFYVQTLKPTIIFVVGLYNKLGIGKYQVLLWLCLRIPVLMLSILGLEIII